MSEGVKRIFTVSDVTTLPPMIRFPFVRINLIDAYKYKSEYEPIWNTCFQSFEEWCNQSIAFLQQIQVLSFTYSTLEIRGGVIHHDYTGFYNHRQVVDYAKNLLIPIFNACHRIEFKINFCYDVNGNAAGDLFAQLLQLEPIMSCPDLEVCSSFRQLKLGNVPVDEIANWLCVKPRGRTNGKKIGIHMNLILNGLELIDTLKKVIFFSVKISLAKNFCTLIGH